MSIQILEFFVNGEAVPVTLTRTLNKNMYLKIKGENIVVSAPYLTSMKTINFFVSKNIEKFANRIKTIKANTKYSFKDKFVYLLGKKYDLEIFTGIKKRSFEIVNNVIYLNLKTGTEEEVDKYVKNFLKQLVTEKIEGVQKFWEKEMDIPKHDISVVYKTSTWGTNIISKRKISYSARLAHYDEKVLQYLAVHELAHYKVPNHSKSFWNLVKLYMPNYKEIQKILKLDQTLSEE